MITRLKKAVHLQLLPLALGFVLLAGVIVARYWLSETQLQRNDAIRASFQLESHIAQAMSLVQDAETGQRGFLLTGEDSYLEPYRAAVAAIGGELAAISDGVADDPARLAQVETLRRLIGEKFEELKQTIEIWKDGNAAGALSIVRADNGKRLMDAIRALTGDLRQQEEVELKAGLVASERVDEWLRWASFASLIGILALGAFSLFDGRRRLRHVIQAQDQLNSINAALRDEIRTREAAESQVRQMQKMEAVGQLTGGIAHDFNNMLAVILSAMNLIQRKLARGESDIEKFVEAATDATQRAAKLTARLLAFSRQQPLAPQVVDANRVVTGMSDLLRRALGETIAVETVLGGGLWRAVVDPGELENAILNLAVNGRDAMPEGGSMTIETANAHLDDAYAAAHEDVKAGQYVMVAVTDTGTGMTPEVVARAFDPFFTTKAVDKGTGLGLSQVFGFVKQSGGHVKIYSEPGKGTTIKIYLQRHFGEEPVQREAAPARQDETQPTETVLVVEDDHRVRAGSVDALRELGYTVIHAGSGEEALRKLDEHPDVALLFTDIVMPAMDGRKLAEEATARRPGLKVLFTTGFTRNAVVHNGVLDHGVNFLAKPFTVEQLAAKVREVLAQ